MMGRVLFGSGIAIWLKSGKTQRSGFSRLGENERGCQLTGGSILALLQSHDSLEARDLKTGLLLRRGFLMLFYLLAHEMP
jgi:hypothetical protein